MFSMGTLNSIKGVFDVWNSTGISFISNENNAMGFFAIRAGYQAGVKSGISGGTGQGLEG